MKIYLHGLANQSLSFLLQNELPEGFYRKGVLKIFAKFTGKSLCQTHSTDSRS